MVINVQGRACPDEMLVFQKKVLCSNYFLHSQGSLGEYPVSQVV